MVSYKPLWKMLIEKDMKKMQLKELIGCSNGTLARMGKNEYVQMELIDKICEKLECKVEDIVEFIPNVDNLS